MEESYRNELYNTAKDWVLGAGKYIREQIDEPLEVETKSSAKDLVTQMDKNTESFFAERIRSKYSDHKILSEEGFGDVLETLEGIVWIIDPIDGTMNFVNQKQNFAISIGIYQDGIGEIGLIYNVMDDVLYSSKRSEGAYKNEKRLPMIDKAADLGQSILILNAFWACENKVIEEKPIQALIKEVRGTRSYGSAALELAYLTEGIVDSYFTMKLAPWDLAAGLVMLNEVGGTATQADGREINMLKNNSLLASKPSIHKEIIKKYIVFK